MSRQQQNHNRRATNRFSGRPGSKLTPIALALGCLYPAPAVLADETATLEEILVTASKTGATSLMNTAVTATVVGGAQIEKREILSVEDIQFQTPGMIVDASNASPKVAIRGIGHDGTLLSAEGGVAIYSNDIILQRIAGLTAAFFDLERVEVLKGPQGTAFGRNATGGSVNYVGRRPQEGTQAELSVTAGTDSRQEISGIFNYGSDDYGVRIGAKYNDQDGWADNLTTGNNANDIEQTVFRSSFSFAPSDNFDGIFRFDYTDETTGDAVGVVTAEPFSAPQVVGGTVSFDPDEEYEIHADLENVNDMETTLAALHLDWDIGDLHLRSITGYYSADFDVVNDADQSDADFIPVPMQETDADQFSQEFVLSSSAGALDWLVGAYYLQEDSEQDMAIDFALFFDPQGRTVLWNDKQDLTSTAAFAQATWSFDDKTRLRGGVRYTEDEKEMDYGQSFVFGPLNPEAGTEVTTCDETFDETWDDVTWDLTLERDLSDDQFAYVKVNTGFKAGGFDPTGCGATYDPEDITAYEIGYKGTFNDGRLSLESSAFYYDYSDLQVSQVEADPATGVSTSVVRNAAEAEVYGIDLSVQALLSDSFSVDLGLSWLPTAEYDEYFATDALDVREFTRTGVSEPLDVSGNRLNRAPEYSGIIGLNYETELSANWSVDARVELYFVDDIRFSPYDRPNAFNAQSDFPLIEQPLMKDSNIQDGYELLNAYVSFNHGETWTIRLYGKNLTDEYYYSGIIENSGNGNIHGDWGRPLEAGVQAVYRFAN